MKVCYVKPQICLPHPPMSAPYLAPSDKQVQILRTLVTAGKFHSLIPGASSLLMASRHRVRSGSECCQPIFILVRTWAQAPVMLQLSGHIHAWNLP